MYATSLPDNAVPIDELRTFLLDNRTDLYESDALAKRYAWMKGVCLYDRLAFAAAPKARRRARKSKPSTNATPAKPAKRSLRRKPGVSGKK